MYPVLLLLCSTEKQKLGKKKKMEFDMKIDDEHTRYALLTTTQEKTFQSDPMIKKCKVYKLKYVFMIVF